MDSVTWMKNGVEITEGNSDYMYSRSQIITDESSDTYQHTLFVRNVLHFVGNFTCIVKDVVNNTDTRDLTSEVESLLLTLMHLLHDSIMQLVLWVTTFHQLMVTTQFVCLVPATVSLVLRAVRCASVCMDTTGVHRSISMSLAPVSLEFVIILISCVSIFNSVWVQSACVYI